MRSHNLVLLSRQHQFDKANGLALGLRPVNLCPGEFHDAHLFVLLLGLDRRQADTRRFRVGERTPGDDAIIHLLLPKRHKGIAHSNPRLVRRDVRKEVAADHIANRQDIRRGGLEIGIHLDAFVVILHARRLQVQPLDIRLTPHRQDNLIGLKLQQLVTSFGRDNLLLSVTAGFGEARPGHDFDAF